MRTSELSKDAVAAADWVAAIDPDDITRELTIWGDDTVPPCVAPGAPARKIQKLEITCDSDDEGRLAQIVELVKEVRGHASSRLPNPLRMPESLLPEPVRKPR